MVRSFRRGALAAAVVALSALSLAACAAGNEAETLKVKPDNPAGAKGDIQVQNAFVLTDPNGPAAVTARLFNNGDTDQTLDSVNIVSGPSAQLSGANGTGGITVPAHGTVLVGGKGNASGVISSGQEQLQNGGFQNAVFTFSGAGQIPLKIQVMPAASYFAPYGPGSLPTTEAPTPTATSTETPGGTARPTDTASPTGTATATS
ncbi:hypothetical protein [Streptomyces sp. NRRL F-5123]|uniref:hypothetical protein n=1 Tax=Streptomyces sp. NRRL F-5123 TaxID=1463856 RepID=UPI0004E0DF34|nr:hypothetical protein [Streptomyces sp. NRRL F-5123]